MAALPMGSSPLTGRTLAHYRVAEKIGMMCIGHGDYFGECCKLYESTKRTIS